MNFSTEKISIIGGGVSGLSCALILQTLGFEVTIYAKQKTSENPLEVSSFPSASVIPHSVKHPNLISLFKNSLSFFEYLHNHRFKGLTTHRHFELFAHQESIPEYVSEMEDSLILNSFDTIPIKSGIEFQTGWEYKCFFADWPLYFPELLSRFRQKGGSLVFGEITHESFEKLESQIVINCSEFGSLWLFEEDFSPIIYRGHLLFVEGAPMLRDTMGKTISYNVTPGSDHYKSSQGTLQDVYVYPRKDGWILGGSRQKGTIDKEMNWKGETTIEPYELIHGQSFPEQILSLNQEIILQSFGVDLREYKDRELRMGYRFMGNRKEELRLEPEERNNRLFIHNYGHGGAGVTISWGCAIQVASMVLEKLGVAPLSIEEVYHEFMK